MCCALCQRKLFGCAPILNRFLVAPLFHYLIGKKGFPLLPWFPLYSQAHSICTIVHILSEVDVLVLFCFPETLIVGPPQVSSSTHGIFGEWNRKSHCLSLPTDDVLHTLHVVTAFSVMFNLSPELGITVFLLVFDTVYVKYTLHAISTRLIEI